MSRWQIDVGKLLMVLVPVAFLGFSGVATAQQVVGTDHDLNTSTTVTGTTEICIFCHTPHTTSALSPESPLWNRSASVTTFTMYDSNVSPSIDMIVAAAPQGVSMGCLSCHDGATAYNSLINTAGQSITTTPSAMSGGTAIGATGDLTNDHPISVTYDPAQDPDFVALSTVRTSSLVRLFGTNNDQVECGSCHDPHDNSQGKFQRASNAGSQVCLTCHIK